MKSRTVYVPELATFLKACEGTGDNLLPEDIEAGYVDYVYITTYIWDGDELIEEDGGQLLLKIPFREIYGNDEYGGLMTADAMKFMWDKEYAYVEIKEQNIAPYNEESEV